MILITGGTGFVGKWMKHMRPTHLIGRYIGRAEYDDGEWGRRHYLGIVHLAPIDPLLILKYAKREKIRVLYCSSGAAYDLDTEYAENKRRWEKECLESGLDVVIARLFTFSGAGLDSSKAIVEFENKTRNNQPITISGNGNAVRTYMHGSTMARWMWAILERGQSGEIYDVGGDVKITIRQLAEKMKKKYNSTSEIVVLNGKDDVPYYVPRNTTKTKALL